MKVAGAHIHISREKPPIRLLMTALFYSLSRRHFVGKLLVVEMQNLGCFSGYKLTFLASSLMSLAEKLTTFRDISLFTEMKG